MKKTTKLIAMFTVIALLASALVDVDTILPPRQTNTVDVPEKSVAADSGIQQPPATASVEFDTVRYEAPLCVSW